MFVKVMLLDICVLILYCDSSWLMPAVEYADAHSMANRKGMAYVAYLVFIFIPILGIFVLLKKYHADNCCSHA